MFLITEKGAEPTFLITEKEQKLRFLSPARTDGTEVRHHSLQRVERQRIHTCVKTFFAQAPAVMDNTCGRPNGDVQHTVMDNRGHGPGACSTVLPVVDEQRHGPSACSTVLPVVDEQRHGPGACSTVTMLPVVDEQRHGPGACSTVTMLPWADGHGQVRYGPRVPPCLVTAVPGAIRAWVLPCLVCLLFTTGFY